MTVANTKTSNLSAEDFVKAVEELLVRNYGMQLSYGAKETVKTFHLDGYTPHQCMHFIAAHDGLLSIK